MYSVFSVIRKQIFQGIENFLAFKTVKLLVNLELHFNITFIYHTILLIATVHVHMWKFIF